MAVLGVMSAEAEAVEGVGVTESTYRRCGCDNMETIVNIPALTARPHSCLAMEAATSASLSLLVDFSAVVLAEAGSAD